MFRSASLVACCVAFPVLSKVLERAPGLLHNPNSKLSSRLKQVKRIGHRGCTQEGIPENSMAAFQHAVDQNVCCIELDVRLTADNRVVIFHDGTLSRMTNGKTSKSIEEMKFKDLPALEPSDLEQQSDEGRRGSHRIPLFSEVLVLLDKHPHLTMIVEFKEDNDELIRLVHGLIQPYAHERIVWFSLKTQINNKLRRYDPTIPTIVSAVETLQYVFFYYLGLIPFMSMPFCVFGITLQEIPLSRLRNEASLKDIPDPIKRALAWLLAGCPPWMFACPGLFQHLQSRGYPVWFLGVNEERHIEASLTLGANAVLTDRPRWLDNAHNDGHLQLKGMQSTTGLTGGKGKGLRQDDGDHQA